MPRILKHEVNFLGNRNYMFILSAVLVVIAIVAICINGLNFSIEFKGGTKVDYTNTGDVTLEQMRSEVAAAGDSDATVQTANNNGTPGFIVRTAQTDSTVASGNAQTVADSLGLSADSYQVTTVGPDWGSDVTRTSLIAFLVSIALIIIYIAIRFEYKMGFTAVLALFHDLIIVIGVYALFSREISPNTIAALLTILGYSLYDTVVVFHRIKDNTENGGFKCSFMRMANFSVNQVFTRTVNTTLTSLIPVVIMLFFGGDTLKDFAFAMTIGLISGSYSSIGIAAPIYALWKQREPKNKKLKAKYPGDIGPRMKLERLDSLPEASLIEEPAVRPDASSEAPQTPIIDES